MQRINGITKNAHIVCNFIPYNYDDDRCAIHPALFHHSYDIAMFDKRGNKTFDDNLNGKEGNMLNDDKTSWT